MNRKLMTLTLGMAMLVGTLAGCGGGSAGQASDAQVTAAVRNSAAEADHVDPKDDHRSDDERERSVNRFMTLLNDLRAVPQLAPLFDQFQVTQPVQVEDDDRSAGLIRLLSAVRITVDDGMVTITNRETGGVIFTAPRTNLEAGTFYPENLPGGTPTTACTYTYSDWSACQNGTQTRTVVSATPDGCTGTPQLTQACTETTPTPVACTAFTYSAWGACQPDGTQTRTVLTSSPSGCTGGSPVTSQSCTYTPPVTTCSSFTYSAWGACQPDGTQTRTVLTSSPSGCTGGSPVTSQSCTYTPPIDGAALYTQTCSSCHGPLATSNLKGKNISVSLIKSRNMTFGLSDAQLQAIVDAVGP